MTSSYHIIRFVLDDAYEHHARDMRESCVDEQWGVWLAKISKMFKGRPPIGLLLGLKAKGNSALSEACDVLIDAADEKRQRAQDREHQKQLRFEAAQQRNEAKALARRGRRQHDEKEAEAKRRLFASSTAEAYVRQMQPTWNKQFDDILRKRDEQASAW